MSTMQEGTDMLNVLRTLKSADEGDIRMGRGEGTGTIVYALSPREVADYLDMTYEHALRVCNVLRNSGFIRYARDRGDTLVLTPQGRAFLG